MDPSRAFNALRTLSTTALLCALMANTPVAVASGAAATLDAGTRGQVIDQLTQGLEQNYVYADKASRMAAHLRTQQRQGAYDALVNPAEFAERLTADMQAISHDVHLVAEYSEETLPQFGTSQAPAQERLEQELAIMRKLNFGFERIERLPFNIGYLRLDGFAPAAATKSRITAAMTLLGDTRALIIDLRENRGGEPETVALLASYLFDAPVHLTDFYWRDGDRTEHVWTQASVEGPRYGATRPVYVLIGRESFSAAEGFSYALQGLKRATIVGENSGGGAHPGDPLRLTDHFSVFVPNGRSISPVTGTNWEGVGVAPDLRAPAAEALEASQRHVLSVWLADERDTGTRERLQRRIAELAPAAATR